MLKKTTVIAAAVLFGWTAVYAQPMVSETAVENAAQSADEPMAMDDPADSIEQAAPPAAETETAELSAKPAEPPSGSSGAISLDFREADIQNVLRILAYKSGVNIVTGPEVTGLVTIQLKDVPWEQALMVILETYGYGYDRRGNIITVTTIENLKKRREDALVLSEQIPLATQTFPISYGKAADIIASLQKMKTDRGSVNYDERTNTVIVQDIPEQVKLIGEVIAKLDQTTPQVLIEAKIIETTLNSQDNLGIDWITKVSLAGSKRPVEWPFTQHSEGKWLKFADFPATQTTDFTFGTLNFAQVQAILEMLRTRTDTNILSNPRIVTLDNQPATINVGSQYPIPTYTYNEDQAKMQVSGWEYKDIGIIFKVTPHVNNKEFVTIDIEPTITEILDFVTVENTSMPRLSNESAKTKVMIKDGQTLVIGGLIKTKITNVKKKMPILGDIPIAGLLFQKSEKGNVKTDLLVFITPHIINPQPNAPSEAPKE